jgi:hypothetical protein
MINSPSTDPASGMSALQLKLEDMLAPSRAAGARVLINSPTFTRTQSELTDGVTVRTDRFGASRAVCGFLRVSGSATERVAIVLNGGYQTDVCPAGGWLLSPGEPGLDSYWIPQTPHARRMDRDGHILSHRPAQVRSVRLSSKSMALEFDIPTEHVLDMAFWSLPADESELVSSLTAPSVLERQRYFLWSSHTAYERPADLYLHLVHGHVYENHEVWPRYWRVCSELDAYALYVILSGLLKATDKRLYSLLRSQVVFSVVARQAEDGSWRHGEWTDQMESHYRLVNGAVLLLAAYVEEERHPLVLAALERAAAFLAGRVHQLEVGNWFVHDSLEGSAEDIRRYPFPWASSTALGKSPTNMLILNTHLDTIVALDRYETATGDDRYSDLLASARHAAHAVLTMRPAEALYRTIFRILDLTLLPKNEAARLALPMRALKRLGWKYLAPRLHHVKTAFPRLAMPNGFIDRSLCQKGFSTRYQSVHVWDLARFLQRFPDDDLMAILDRALDYTYRGPIRAHWKEAPERQDALGFWVEALYRLCMANPDPKLRHWLAEAVIDAEEVGLGLPPSLLGANPETLAGSDKLPACPSPDDPRLRVVNLGRGPRGELLVVNPTSVRLRLSWERAPVHKFRWPTPDGGLIEATGSDSFVPARGWVYGT